MADLKTNYKDDVLDTSKNTKRKYNTIQNSDGTISLEDVTEYTQKGDDFGAADINATNAKVNVLNDSLSDIDVRYNSETGAPEWSPRGADAWSPFKSVKLLNASTGNGSFSVSDIEGFKKFTVDNFYFVPVSVNVSCVRNPGQPYGANATATITPKISYNPITGVVSLSNCYASFSGGDPHIESITVLGKLYCIH